jgi:uncharacterized lipoprotein YddW (UPF0748 family)
VEGTFGNGEALLIWTALTAVLSEPPPIRREFRAAWIATVDNIDWPSARDLSPKQQRLELVRILDRCQQLNMNAVILQVRPTADAFYPSQIEPWSEYLTGRQGTAPNPEYDPLHFAIIESRRRGLELHVWLNPYRAYHPSQKNPVAPNHISKTQPAVVKKYGRYLWMDPGETIVQDQTLAVVRDLCTRYDIDGVHIDDYFYPYPEKNTPFPDDPSYQRYLRSGGRLDREAWRRSNVDTFIRRMHETIKAVRPDSKFGISPFGIYRPGQPAGIQAGIDQYAQLYADAKKWLVEGWCDYFSPQLYWPISQTAQSYPVLLKWWTENNPKGRHLWVGNFTSRTNPKDGNWKAAEVLNQIKLTREMGAGGNVHFSAKALVNNWNQISTQLKVGPYSEPSLPPATPWLSKFVPGVPKIQSASGDGSVSWRRDPGARWYVIHRLAPTGWISAVVPAAFEGDTQESKGTFSGRSVKEVRVVAVNRHGVESESARAVPSE